MSIEARIAEVLRRENILASRDHPRDALHRLSPEALAAVLVKELGLKRERGGVGFYAITSKASRYTTDWSRDE